MWLSIVGSSVEGVPVVCNIITSVSNLIALASVNCLELRKTIRARTNLIGMATLTGIGSFMRLIDLHCVAQERVS